MTLSEEYEDLSVYSDSGLSSDDLSETAYHGNPAADSDAFVEV